MDATHRDYRKLEFWKAAHANALAVYRATTGFPDDEKFGLRSQLQRAAASVPTNIAEGCGRGSTRELARFLRTAMGSNTEVEYLVHLAHDLGLIPTEHARGLYAATQSVGRQMSSYLKALRKSRPPQPPASGQRPAASGPTDRPGTGG